jgi:hypothetical protein
MTSYRSCKRSTAFLGARSGISAHKGMEQSKVAFRMDATDRVSHTPHSWRTTRCAR